MRTDSRLWPWIALGAFAALAPGVALVFANQSQLAIVMPGIASIVVYLAFAIMLHQRLRQGVFGELGFFFVSLVFAYTLMPAVTFLLADLDTSSGWVWEKLSVLLPDQAELGLHLWRHVLFMTGAAAGYLVLRGRLVAPAPVPQPPLANERTLIVMAIAIIVMGAAAVAAWSAPVVLYVDHYTRFDHLGWFELRIIYVFLLLKTSAYFILMTILFRGFARYRALAITAVIAIGAYELSYSLGQRVDTLGILLGAACLYHFTVRPVTFKASVVGLALIISLFSVVEVVRMLDLAGPVSADLLPDKDLVPASELGTVFFTGFHLYAERSAGSLPPAPLPMLINDLLAVLPFVDHEEWNPMYWYARNYFPESVVPPATVGPIADSAVWGGEIDLALRAAAIGAIYAAVMRWFLPRRQRWWALVIYSYIFATSVMTLKHTVLYQLAPLIRVIGPGLLMFWLAMRILGDGSRKDSVARA